MDLPKEIKEKARGRQQFHHNGQLIYEWEQSIEDVIIYIKPPQVVLPKYRDHFLKQLKPGEQLPKVEIKIEPDRLKIGLKDTKPFIEEQLERKCMKNESVWTIEDEEIVITLQKMLKAEVWDCVFKGHNQLDPITKEEVQKKLLLERFQEENPGFDFSSAEFNGMAPDPRNFMGGVKYN